MKLPNPEMTFIDDSKLTAYSLNFNHDEGKHKARIFKSVLGITLENLEEIKMVLLKAVKNYEAIPTKANFYGQKYIIDFPMTRNNQTAIIHSVWIIRNEENFPRLVTPVMYYKEQIIMNLYDIVALLQDLPELNLYRGQVGTIIEEYEPNVFEVEFITNTGKVYALETLSAEQLMLLHHAPLNQQLATV